MFAQTLDIQNICTYSGSLIVTFAFIPAFSLPTPIPSRRRHSHTCRHAARLLGSIAAISCGCVPPAQPQTCGTWYEEEGPLTRSSQATSVMFRKSLALFSPTSDIYVISECIDNNIGGLSNSLGTYNHFPTYSIMIVSQNKYEQIFLHMRISVSVP